MSKHTIRDADLTLFTVLWNQHQNMTTPQIHLRMIEWLEQRWIKGDKNLLVQAFRSAGKSTIIGLFAAWCLYRNPDLRILVLAADTALAKKMVRNVKRILERHPLTEHLKPSAADQWAGERFTVQRGLELRDPSMLARGITSNITGSRADLIICDDVEVPNTCDTAEKREDLRNRLAEVSFILVPRGTQIYVGTPHTYHTIYAEAPRVELDEDAPFLNRFKRYSLPIRNSAGTSVWPDRFSNKDIRAIERQSGPNRFASQMMLTPMNINEGRLNPDLLRTHDCDLEYTKELKTLFIGSRKMVAASAWWDPSFASARGDHSVCAISFVDEDGNFYIQDVSYIKIDTTSNEDEATQQCQIIAELMRKNYVPSITVESNGIGKFLPAILRNTLAKERIPCRVVEKHNNHPKDLRILEAFDAPLAARRLYIHRSILQTPFMTEMREWRPGSSKGHDDGLDAVAGALSQQPMRLKRLYGKGEFSWMNNANKPHNANTNFNV